MHKVSRRDVRDGAFLVVFAFALTSALEELGRRLPDLGSTHIILGGLASLLLGWLLADLASGVIHFIADNWGSPDTPLFGPLLIAPFREHHTTPTSILEHGFLERNANNALVATPLVAWIPWAPLDRPLVLLLAAAMTQMALWAALTNEIHAAAHAPRAPRWLEILQEWHVVLSPEHHRTHHRIITSQESPQGFHYCITSGACDHLARSIGALLHRPKRLLNTSARAR